MSIILQKIDALFKSYQNSDLATFDFLPPQQRSNYQENVTKKLVDQFFIYQKYDLSISYRVDKKKCKHV